MKRKNITLYLILFLSMVLYGCAGTQMSSVSTEAAMTRNRLDVNRAETHAEYQDLKAEITLLGKRLDSLSKNQADFKSTLAELQTLLRQTNQVIQQLNAELESTKRSQKAVRPMHTLPTDNEQNPESIYQTAYNDYVNRKLDLAIMEFQDFLSSFPDSDLADNAQYWIGECYYSQGKYELARIEFEKVQKNFPNGDKVVSALLKQGLCYVEVGNDTMARTFLEDLINRFPYSAEASIAKDRLSALN